MSVQSTPLHGGAQKTGAGEPPKPRGLRPVPAVPPEDIRTRRPGEKKEALLSSHCTNWLRSCDTPSSQTSSSQTSSQISYSTAGSRDYFQDSFIKKTALSA